MKSVTYAIVSGFLAALASMCGKLAMTIDAPLTLCESTLQLTSEGFKVMFPKMDDDWVSTSDVHAICFRWMMYIRFAFFVLMILSNAVMWTVFTKALSCSRTTLEASITNTAANFFFTAVFGQVIFGEDVTFLWWIGTVMIVFGLVLITAGNRELAAKTKKRD